MGVPLNAIAMWSGTILSIPSGWNLCDGTNSTPDLRDKFVRGAPAATEAGTTGGAVNHNHTEQSAGAHTHATDSQGGHTHTTSSSGDHNHGTEVRQPYGSGRSVSTATTAGAHTHTTQTGGAHTHTLDSQGAHTHTVDNADGRPPYYEVLFIQATSTAEVAAGVIIVWSGLRGDIPTGWNECDGNSGRPNLQTKFVAGAPNGVGGGGTGGSADHTHTTQNCAGHTHGTDSQGDHYHAHNAYSVNHNHGSASSGTKYSSYQSTADSTFAHTHANTDTIGAHTHTFQSGGIHSHTVGAADSNESLPAYCDIIFIYNTSATDIPLGGILIWVGLLAAIPSQYNLCDGSSPRPDLRAKFIRGVASGSEAGGTGGADSHNHTDGAAGAHNDHTQNAFSTAHQHAATDNIGAHTHGVISSDNQTQLTKSIDNSAGAHSHTFTNDAWSHTHTPVASADHQHTIDTNADTRPPFYQVQFIYRTVSAQAWTQSGTQPVSVLQSSIKAVTVSPKTQALSAQTLFLGIQFKKIATQDLALSFTRTSECILTRQQSISLLPSSLKAVTVPRAVALSVETVFGVQFHKVVSQDVASALTRLSEFSLALDQLSVVTSSVSRVFSPIRTLEQGLAIIIESSVSTGKLESEAVSVLQSSLKDTLKFGAEDVSVFSHPLYLSQFERMLVNPISISTFEVVAFTKACRQDLTQLMLSVKGPGKSMTQPIEAFLSPSALTMYVRDYLQDIVSSASVSKEAERSLEQSLEVYMLPAAVLTFLKELLQNITAGTSIIKDPSTLQFQPAVVTTESFKSPAKSVDQPLTVLETLTSTLAFVRMLVQSLEVQTTPSTVLAIIRELNQPMTITSTILKNSQKIQAQPILVTMTVSKGVQKLLIEALVVQIPTLVYVPEFGAYVLIIESNGDEALGI